MTADPVLRRLGAALGVEFIETDQLEAPANLPANYVVASHAHYEGGKNPISGRDMGYSHAVQLLDKSTGSCPRGTGNSYDEALANALAKVTAHQALDELTRTTEDLGLYDVPTPRE